MASQPAVVAPAIRPDVYRTRHYAAFRVTDTNRTYPLVLKEAPATLNEALAAALSTQVFVAKERLVIKETDDERGTVTLHVYAIKRQSRPTYVWRDHAQHREHRHYADLVCSIDGKLVLAEAPTVEES